MKNSTKRLSQHEQSDKFAVFEEIKMKNAKKNPVIMERDIARAVKVTRISKK